MLEIIKNFEGLKKQKRKSLKLNKQSALVYIGSNKAVFKTHTFYLRYNHIYKLSKDIDSFLIWQNRSIISLKIDRQVFGLVNRFNW